MSGTGLAIAAQGKGAADEKFNSSSGSQGAGLLIGDANHHQVLCRF